jgi:DNA repair exonuclease SbcCD ATPase subunit
MQLNYLRISGFRGINCAIKLEPRGKSVLLVANNGNGKTSILQAIEWALFGELPCLEGEEFKREDALVNLFDKEGTALVEMGIESEDGVIVEIVRERKRMAKTSGKSTIAATVDGAVFKGGKAQEKINQFLNFSINEYNTMVHLHQEVVREIIEGNEESRDKAINKILGVDALSNFEEVITKQVHQSSTANKSMRGMQKIVNELGIQRETTENTKKEEEKAFEKIKAKLIDKSIDISQTSKESDRLFTVTVSEMLKAANELGLDQLEIQISNLQKNQ